MFAGVLLEVLVVRTNKCVEWRSTILMHLRWGWGTRKLFPEMMSVCFVTYQTGFRKAASPRLKAISSWTLTQSQKVANQLVYHHSCYGHRGRLCMWAPTSHYHRHTHRVLLTDYVIIVHILIYIRRSARAQDKSKKESVNQDRVSVDMIVRLLVFTSFPIIGIASVPLLAQV